MEGFFLQNALYALSFKTSFIYTAIYHYEQSNRAHNSLYSVSNRVKQLNTRSAF